MLHGSGLPPSLPPSSVPPTLPSCSPPLSRSPPTLPSYLLLLLLLVLLGEEGVDPPDLGEHAAVRQAEAEAEQPQAELARQREDRERDKSRAGVRGREEETFPFKTPSFIQRRRGEILICFHLSLSTATIVLFIYNHDNMTDGAFDQTSSATGHTSP